MLSDLSCKLTAAAADAVGEALPGRTGEHRSTSGAKRGLRSGRRWRAVDSVRTGREMTGLRRERHGRRKCHGTGRFTGRASGRARRARAPTDEERVDMAAWRRAEAQAWEQVEDRRWLGFWRVESRARRNRPAED